MLIEPIARLVVRRGWLIVLFWIAVAVLLRGIAPSWSVVSKDDDVRFFPEGSLSVDGQKLLDRGFPTATASLVVIVAERSDQPLTQPDRAFLITLSDSIRDLVGIEDGPNIVEVIDARVPFMDEILVGRADEGEAVLTLVRIDATYLSKQTRLSVNAIEEVLQELEEQRPEGLNLALTGSAVVGHDTNEASNASIDATTWTTVGLVVAILLLVYRSPLLALIPLVAIALSVFIALKGIPMLTWIPGLEFQVINVTRVFVVVVLFGAGTDYCLFLIARYREERSSGLNMREALSISIRKVGAALIASAGTVIIGLGMLRFSTFAKIQYSGPAIALSLTVALGAALTLAPVLLGWFGNAIDWPFRSRKRSNPELPDQPNGSTKNDYHGFWNSVANLITERPILILSISLVLMTSLAVFGVRARPNYGQLSDLPASAPSQAGAALIRKYFKIGELGPTTLLIADRGVDFSTEVGRSVVSELSERLESLPEIATVRSLTQPLGEPITSSDTPPGPATEGRGGLLGIFQGGLGQARQLVNNLANRRAEMVYLGTDAEDPEDRGHITRLDLALNMDPFSEEGLDAIDAIRAEVLSVTKTEGGSLEGAEFGFAGSTAQLYDLRAVITVDQQRMYVLVTAGVYVVLVLLLRKPGISLYLIATVVLGYMSTLGLTELTFQALHEGPEPWGGLDWKVGFFLFVILVAIGEDYNILLMSRVVEEEQRYEPIEATRRAVASTGGIISSCGLIMAGTFGSMLTGKLLALKELGFALCVGVLLDTFIVRPILVPTFLVLLERIRRRFRTESADPSKVQTVDAASKNDAALTVARMPINSES